MEYLFPRLFIHLYLNLDVQGALLASDEDFSGAMKAFPRWKDWRLRSWHGLP
jgi:hypothetical protein